MAKMKHIMNYIDELFFSLKEMIYFNYQTHMDLTQIFYTFNGPNYASWAIWLEDFT